MQDARSNENGEVALSAALDEVRNRISYLQGEKARIEKVLAAAREEEQLLLRVMTLRRGELDTPPKTGSLSTDDARAPVAPSTGKVDCVEAVVNELATSGRPLHISDLMRLLRQRAVMIPGAGNQANLISHIRREPRVVRTSRGMYGLRAWGLEDMPKKGVRRRRKLRARSKS